jgi:putative peptidoglycan lipid II flippase
VQPIRLISGFVTVGFWTFLSRIFGFIRDILIAAFLGSGPVAEAFLIAFSLPNMFRRFFAEGAFNMAFVPMFAKRVEADEDPLGFAEDAWSAMIVVLAVFTVLGIVFMPALVYAMASGFAGDERFDLAVEYGRLAFPYILFISLTALVSGVLNATGRFLAAAAAPVLLNLVFIAAMLVGAALGRPLSDAMGTAIDEALGLRVGATLALSVPLGGIAQLRARLVGGLPRGLPPPPPPPPDHAGTQAPRHHRRARGARGRRGAGQPPHRPPGRELLRRRRGLALLCRPALPAPARRRGHRHRRRAPARPLPPPARGRHRGRPPRALPRAEISLALTVPAAVALAVIPIPLVSVLFQRGAFDADDVAATALAVAVYGAGCRPSSSRRSTSRSTSRARTRAPLHLRPLGARRERGRRHRPRPLHRLHRRRPRHHHRGLGHGLAPLARRPRHGRGRAPRRPRRAAACGASSPPPPSWARSSGSPPSSSAPASERPRSATPPSPPSSASGWRPTPLAGRALGAFTMADLRGAVRR